MCVVLGGRLCVDCCVLIHVCFFSVYRSSGVRVLVCSWLFVVVCWLLVVVCCCLSLIGVVCSVLCVMLVHVVVLCGVFVTLV